MRFEFSKRRNMLVCLAVLVLAVSLFLGWEWYLQTSQQDFCQLLESSQGVYNDNRIVLSGTTHAKAQHLADILDGTLRITKSGTFATITLPDGVTVSDVANADEYRPYLAHLSLDYNNFKTSEAAGESEEERAGALRSTYRVNDLYYPQQTYLDYINIGDSWKMSRGTYPDGEKVTVAIIDTGIDTDHPDFFDVNGKLIISSESYDATDDMIVSRYGLGVIEDEVGHGTKVAGVIAAQMNDIGIAGIAPEIELLVIKVEQNEKGNFHSMADLVFAIYYAIEKDVDVINMSWSGGDHPDLRAALQLAIDSDIIPVASAGNGNTFEPAYPAAYTTTIGVGALDNNSWNIASYSNYGDNVDLMAPGTTLTTSVGGGYLVDSGTSLAAPVVSAAVALYISQNKYVNYNELKTDLLAACVDLGELGKDYKYGFGALDVNAFVCEDKGTITYDYCTEEISTTKQVFVRHHTIQTVPEPERSNVVFDDWYYDKAYTRVFDYDAWYSTEFVSDVTLYAKWVNEDDLGASVYNYKTLEDGTVEIVSYKGKRRYLEIPETLDGKTVSSIGKSAFDRNGRLRKVTFPSGLVHIKDNAFYFNTRLRELVFTGTKLQDIGKSAFEYCAIRSLQLPDSVVTLGSGAFQDNYQLKNLQISENSDLTQIGGEAFSNCALTTFYLPKKIVEGGFSASVLRGCKKVSSITVHPENVNYTVDKKTLYDKNITKVVYHPSALSGTYTTPDTVTTIDQYAFGGSSVTEVVLRDSVTLVDCCAFSYSNLETITLSENLEKISDQVFMFTKLMKIHIPASVVEIKAGAFVGCDNLEQVTFGEGSRLTKIDGDTANRGAFEDCGRIKEFVFPDTLQDIGTLAFAGCDSLERIYIPSKVSSMGDNAFRSCSSLKTVEFDDACLLEEIPEHAFYGCSQLEQVTFSQKIVKLREGAFRECFALKTLKFPEDSALKSVGPYSFYSCTSLQTLQLPQSIEILDEFSYAFSGLRKAEISAKINEVGDAAFGACQNLTVISVDEQNSTYTAQDNVLFSKDMATVFCVPASRIGTYSVPGSVRIIAPYSFYYDQYLTGVVFPEGLDDIQHDAFYHCDQLVAIDIPLSVANIGRCAFQECYSLKTVNLPEGGKLTRLGINTFVGCGIEEIVIPASVDTMAQSVFSNCGKLKTVTFAAGSKLPYLAAYVFKGTGVEHVVFEEGSALTSLQAHAFDGAVQLKSVDFGDAALENIDNYAFSGCYNLQNIDIPDTVTYIGRYAFYGCNQVQKIFIPSSVEFVGEYAFARMWIGSQGYVYPAKKVFFEGNSLPAYIRDGWDHDIAGYFLAVKDYVSTDTWEYTIKSNGATELAVYKGNESILVLNKVDGLTIEGIGPLCFQNKNISSITLPQTLLKLGNRAFYGCGGIKELTIPASVEEIGSDILGGNAVIRLDENSQLRILGDYAFRDCVVESLVLPDSVEDIGDYAFANVSLGSLTIRETSTLKRIGNYAFTGSTITELYLPTTLEEIGVGAFQDTPSMTELSIAGGNTPLKLSNSAFENCGFPEVNLPERVYYVGEYTFGSCQNLLSINVDAANKSYTSSEGVLYDIYGATLIQYPCGREGAYEIPKKANVLTYASFKNAKKLTEITFEEGSQVRTIGWETFSGCEKLTKITVPDSVVSFDFYAFRDCTALTDVILGENSLLTGVYEGAFYNCAALENISLPDSIVEISDYAFYNCQSLPAVPLSENAQIKGIYDYAFYNCPKLTTIPAFKQLEELGDCAFGNTGVTEFHIPTSMLEFDRGAFVGCKEFTSITCDEDHPVYVMVDGAIFERGYDEEDMMGALVFWPPNKVLELGKDHTTLTREEVEKYMVIPDVEVVIADSVTQIGDEAFRGFAGMRSVNIPKNVVSIGVHAFEDCVSLQDIYFNATALPDMDDGRFNYAGAEAERTTLTVGKNVTRIPSSLFCSGTIANRDDNNTHITELIFEEGSVCTAIGDRTFKNVRSLQKITLPEGLITIGEEAFYRCSPLEPIMIPSSVTTIGSRALDCKTILLFPDEKRPANLGEDWSGYSPVLEESTTWGSFENWLMYYVNDRKEAVLCIYRGTEESVVIPSTIDGYPVTILDSNVFRDFRADTVVLPDSVTTIGDGAFTQASIRDLTIGPNVTSIGNSAFSSAQVDNLVFNASNLSTLGEKAFNGAGSGGNKGMNIIIGADMEVIPDSLFSNATIRSITFAPDTGCHTIGANAFSNTAFVYSPIQELVLPNTITTIGNGAFAGLKSLQLIALPESVTSVGENAFNCNKLIMQVTPEQMETLGDKWYGAALPLADFKKLITDENGQVYVIRTDDTVLAAKYHGTEKSVVIPAQIQGYPVTEVAANAYYDSDITSIQLPDTITRIGHHAFYSCESLEKINVPSGVTSIGAYAFYYCQNLAGINLSKSVTSIGEYAFYSCKKLENLVLPEELTEIGQYAFYDCDGLIFLEIPGGVSKIPDYAFASISALKEVHIGAGVQEIGFRAFENCVKLETVEFPDTMIKIGNQAFSSCSVLGEVFIPESVTTVGEGAFYNCPKAVLFCGGTFPGTQNPGCTYYENVVSWGTTDNDFFYLVRKDGTAQLVKYLGNAEELVYPSQVDGVPVTNLAEGIFRNCTTLKKITLPNTVTTIGNFAFQGCSNLVEVNLSAATKRIGNSAFENCFALADIQFPDTLEYIGDSAFRSCYKLTRLEIPNSVTSIGGYAFYGCSGITSLKLSEKLTAINAYSFHGCKLNEIVIPALVTKIGDYAFADMTPETVFVEGAVTTWGIGSFEMNSETVIMFKVANPNIGNLDSIATWCSDVKGFGTTDDGWQYCVTNDNKVQIAKYRGTESFVIIPGQIADMNVVKLANKAFSGNSAITDVVVPDHLSEIHGSTFDGCINLKNVDLPEEMDAIGSYAFADCRNLSGIDLPNGLSILNESVFSSCQSLTDVHIPESVTQIKGAAFSGCTGLQEIVIPENVKRIGRNAFVGCTSLTRVKFEGIVDYVEPNAFSRCTGLTELHSGINNSGNHAFSDCSNLKKLSFAEGVTQVGQYAFDYCTALEEIHIPSTMRYCYSDYFTNCPNVKLVYILSGFMVSDGCPTNVWPSAKTISIGANLTEVGDDITQKYAYTEHIFLGDVEYVAYSDHEHQWENTVSYVAGSANSCCTGQRCSVCGLNNDSSAETHVMVSHEAKAATCTEIGWEVYEVCSSCGYSTYREISAVGHTTESAVTTPTCTNHGYTTYTCATCGENWKGAWVSALAHDWKYQDNGDGTHDRICKTCETMNADDENHSYLDGKCICGAEETVVEPPATGTLGDLNLDDKVDSDDLTLLARHVGGIELVEDPQALSNCDVNGDGQINSDDLTKHARYVGGIITAWDQE